MIGSFQLLLLVTLLACAAKSEILNAKDFQTCINLCSSCGGVSIFSNDICDCRIPENDVAATECLNHIMKQISDLPAETKSSEDEIANRAARCSGQTGSVEGSTRQIASDDVDRVANYFMNGGPLTGTSLLGAQDTGCVSSTKDEKTGGSSASNVSAKNPAEATSKFDAPAQKIPILGAQPKKPSTLTPKIPSLAANPPKTPSLGASSAKSSGVGASCGKSATGARSSSPLGSNPVLGTPYGLSQGPQSSSLVDVIPQVLLGIPHAVLDAVPGLLGLMHPQLLGAAQHPHLLGPAQHPHLLGAAQHPHLLGRAQHPHLLGRAQHPHLLGAAQHPHLLGPAQRPHLLGATQNSPLLDAMATETHRVLQNLDNVVSAYIPGNDHGQMVGAPQSQLTDVITGVPNAIVNTARIPGLLGATQYYPFLGAVASEAHEVIKNLDNIVMGHAPGTDQSQLVGASQAQAGKSQSAKSSSNPASAASVASQNAPADPLHQVLAHHNTLLEALSQHLGSYSHPVGAPHLQYSPIPYNSNLGTSNSNTCPGQGSSALEASSPVAAEASTQAEEPPTNEPTNVAETSTKETLKDADPSTKETSKSADASTKETLKDGEPLTKETSKAADASTKETLKDADPSTKETSKAADASTKETLKDADPSKKETSKDADSDVSVAKQNSSSDSSTDEKKNEEGVVPKGDEVAAKGDEEIAPKVDEVAAKAKDEISAKGDEEIAPKVDEVAAKAKDEISAKGDEEIAPKGDEVAAKGNEEISAKGDEEIAPKGDEVAAKGDEEISAKGNEEIAPKGDEVAAKGDEEISAKGDGEIAPKGDEVAAKAKAEISAKGEEEIAPKGNDVAAKGDEVAAEANKVAAKANEKISPKENEEISAKANEIEMVISPHEEISEQPKMTAKASTTLSDNVNCKPKRYLNFSNRRKRQNIQYIKKKDTIVSPTKVR